jgi:hypothetical protein
VARLRRAVGVADGPHWAGPIQAATMPSKNKLTAAQREQRRAQDRERLKQAAEQLLSSDGWRRWVTARVRNGWPAIRSRTCA